MSMLDRVLSFTAWVVVGFILLPLVVIVGGSFTERNFVEFPPTGFTLKWYAKLLSRADFIESFIISLELAAACTVVALVVGTAAAIGMHRHAFRGREIVQAFVMSPLVLPTIVTGVALLQYYYAIALDAPFWGLLMGHVIISVPYVVRSVTAGLTTLGPDVEEAAESLGAGFFRRLFRVTLPMLAPALLVSTIFVFIVSFDQVTVSIFLSGSDLMPLPIRIYTYIDYSIDPMVAAVSTLLILFACGISVVLQRTFGLDRAFGVGGR
jgi:putative spermidine/putrescine transport system permease protein